MSLSDQLWCPASAQVTVLQARGLRIKGKGGTNDAYAVMQVGKEKYQTSVVEKSVAPVWKEEATFDLPQQQQRGGGGGGTERSTLHVHVLHRALVGPDKLLGQAVINLLQLSEDRTRNKTEWFKLLDKTGKADKDRGEVLVDIQFMRNNMTASMFDLSAAGKSRSRLGKFKDKVRGKKKESDTVSTIVPSFTQVLTDSEEEGNGDAEAAAGKDEKKKKHKMKSLFSPKSNLQKNMSQSMSVLPGKNSPLSGSQSSGLNVDPSEGKKKFKFKIHKRSGSSDNKDSSTGLQKHGATEQSNLCINGSHVYCEEPPARTSRIGSNFSLASSGHGSMEDVPDSSPPSVDSLRGVRQYSPWTEEEEEMAEVENIKEDVEEERTTLEEEEERMRQDEDAERLAEEKRRQEQRRVEEEEKRQREEERRIRIEEEKAQEERRRQEEEQRLAEEKRRLEEEERRRNEEEKLRKEEEERIQREEEEERSRREEEERARREEERERVAEEKRRLEEEEEEERRRIKEDEKRQREEEERIRMAEERAKEERRRQEAERKLAEEKMRLEEEERRMIEEEEVRRLEEQERKRIEEEERIRMEEEMAREQQRREEEESAKRQEEERKLAEQKRRLEEEERRQREEEEWKRQEEEDKLAEEKRLEEEERRRIQEEEDRKEEEEKRREEEERSRREEEELVRKLEEERKEKRMLEEQERKRMEQEERIKKEEEEKARREKEEYERLVEKKMKLEEEERKRIEAEEKIRKEEEERVKAEEDRRRKEEERRQEEQEKLAAEKRIMEEQQRRIEEEEKKQREEEERIRKEEERRHQEEERKRIVEEERIRQEEEEKIRMEKERRSREAEEDKNKMEEEERARKLEKVIRNVEERKKRANKTKQEVAGTKSKVGSSTQVCSTNPFDEEFSNNPFDENPNSPDCTTVLTVQQRSQPAVSSAGSKTSSTDEKDFIGSQREKRPAPLPPGRNQDERRSQREQDGSTRHLVQVNKQSKDKDDKTVSVPPQRSVQMIVPLSRSPTDTKNPQSLAQNKGKRPAPSAPAEPKKASSSDGKIANKSSSEAKQESIAYGLNPFEDDEDENEHTAQDITGSIQGPLAVSQADDGDAASQAKIKSSKKAHAPLLPATTAAASSTSISQNTEGGHDTGATTQDDDLTHPLHPEEAPVQESQPVMAAAQEAGGKKEAPPVTSRRLQPVKPLNPLGQQPVSVAQGEIDNKSTGIHSDVEEKTKANDTELKGPYAQLTREELISLVLKQDNQLSERDKKICELEQYIDNLLVRVMEESPTILMSMNSMKKTV